MVFTFSNVIQFSIIFMEIAHMNYYKVIIIIKSQILRECNSVILVRTSRGLLCASQFSFFALCCLNFFKFGHYSEASFNFEASLNAKDSA